MIPGRELAAVLVSDERLDAMLQQPERLGPCWAAARDDLTHVLLASRILERSQKLADREFLASVRHTRAAAAAREAFQYREMIRVAGALCDSGVPALLLKGAAWAYQVYPRPELRPRLDTDLLIARGDRARAGQTLHGLGYTAAIEHVMELASAQRHFSLTAAGFTHHVDLHWRVTNPLAFANALPFESLWERSVAIDALGGARAPGLVDALLLACLHRVAHHGLESGVLWVHDIHLLARALTGPDWADFVRAADTWRLRPVVEPGLARAVEWFGTPIPDAVLQWARSSPDGELERAFSRLAVIPLEVLASDWRAARSWRKRARLLQDHVCPPAIYMRHRYGDVPNAVLPVLYALRLTVGASRWVASWLARVS
jgi:Uncharacterised nucleotidyltransferase